MLVISIFLFVVALKDAESFNILGIFPMPATSHYILGSKLMKGLAEAGHNITMISPYKLTEPPKNGSYTDVLLEGLAAGYEKAGNTELFKNNLQSPIHQMKIMADNLLGFSNKTLHHPNVKKLLQSNAKFDAVIMEQLSNDALKVFSHIYNCPLIILSSIGPNSWVNPTVGNPQPVSYVAHMRGGDFSNDITFYNRAKNLYLYISEYLLNRYYIHKKHDEIMRQAFPDVPPFYDLYTNVSLVLLNSHTSIYPALPVVPNMVEIGGFSIDKPKKLPEDLQNILDDAKDGAVYFSMGTHIKSKDMCKSKQKAIINVLGRLKQKVLWKFEENIPNKPTNIIIKDWMPQSDILAHPNIKLFISHGGLMGITETIYHGVPTLAIPVFGDQLANSDRVVTNGYGLKLGYNDPNFTEETFGALVNEVMNNPKYKINAQRLSKIFHDRPQEPMETAVFWVEYVIRHNGATLLRVAGVRLPWYQYFMIDVILFLLFSFILIFYSLKFIFTKLIFNFKKCLNILQIINKQKAKKQK